MLCTCVSSGFSGHKEVRRASEGRSVCVCVHAHVHACMKDQETSWEEIRKQIIEVYSTLILKILLLLIIF